MKDKLLGIIGKIKSFIGPRLKPRAKFVYVAIGDSTVEGIGATDKNKNYASIIYESIRKENKKAEFYNLGKSGAAIADVIDTQLQRAISLGPDLVTVSVGVNDIRKRTRLSNFERDLTYLVNSLSEHTRAKIILNGLPDFSHAPAIPFLIRIYARYMVKKFNEVLREQASKANVTFIDLSNSSLFTKKYPELISPDGFHPSDLGYAFWAAAIISQAQDIFTKGGEK